MKVAESGKHSSLVRHDEAPDSGRFFGSGLDFLEDDVVDGAKLLPDLKSKENKK
jgi:hypothetical protein